MGLTDIPATRTIVIGTDALKLADVMTADYWIIPNGILSNAQVTSRYHRILGKYLRSISGQSSKQVSAGVWIRCIKS